MWGIVHSIDSAAKTVTLESGIQYSPGATFLKGCLFEVVPTVTYTSNGSYGGITRNDGWGTQTLVSSGQFTLTYLDSNADALALPLVASSDDPFPVSAIQNVHAINILVEVRSSSLLSDGTYYVATATQSVGIRNLNYKY